MKRLKLFFACLLMAVLSIGQMWAGTATYSMTPDATTTGSSATSYWSSLTEFTHDGVSWQMNYLNPSTLQTKTNQSSAASEFRFYNSSAFPGKITKVVVTYSALTLKSTTTTGFMFVGGTSAVTGTTGGDNAVWDANEKTMTWTPAANTNYTYFAFYMNGKTATGSNYLAESDAIVVTYDDGQGGGSDPVAVTGVTLDQSEAEISVGGTVTLTPIVAPNDATNKAVTWESNDEAVATVANGVVTGVAEGTATITVKTVDGNKTATCEVTVAAAPVASGYNVDFESAASTYTDWTFTTLVSQATNSGVTAHGGSYYGGTDGKETGSIVTKNKVANPGTLTFYVTKESNNNTASSWLIKVSSDGTEWTQVGDAQSASAGITKNVWTEVTRDLSGYSNVYVGVFYSGTTAKRCIDDIELSLASDVAKPTISGETPFLTSTTVTITHADADHIYYTTNGDAPTTSSTEYLAPFSLTETATVKAIAVKGSAESAAAEKAFTKATVMTVAQALEAAAKGADKYAKGIIYAIDEVSTEHGNATYYLKDEGQENSIKIYRGKYLNNENFTAEDQIYVGDEVTVFGTISEYSSANQFAQGNYIVALKPAARLAWTGTTEGAYDASLEGANTFPALTNTNGVDVEYSSSNTDAATINPATGEISLVGVGQTTITATFTGNETYKANSVSYTLNVASTVVHATISFDVDGGDAIAALTDRSALPSELPVATKAGKNFGGWFTDSEKTIDAVPGAAITGDITLFAKWLDPYTVAEAKTVIGDNTVGIANQYVAGIISQIDSYNSTYNSITYWISADGTTENQLQVYSGKIGNAATALGKEDFSAKEDLELGDEVVVTGTLKKYNDIYEFDKNNTIYSFNRPEVAVSSVTMTESTAEVEVGSTVTLHASVLPENATNKGINWTVQSGSDKASVADGVVTGIEEGTAVIRAASAADATKYAECTVTVIAVDPTKHVVTFDATADKTTEDTELSLTKGDLTIAITDGDGRFNNETDYRVYKNAEFTVSCANGNITKIEMTCTAGNDATGFADAEGLVQATGTWTGNAASVSLIASVKQVRIETITITYKEDNRAAAGLAWSTDAVELTVGDEFTAPTLNNPNSIAAGEITIASNNTDLATVSEGVVSLVENATGEATITATFAGNEDYKPSVVSYIITVNAAAPVVLTDYYEKVTETAGIVEGTYLIVYEDENVAFNGGLETLDAKNNYIEVEITNDNKIAVTSATEAATVYIDPAAGTIQAANGKYIGVSSNSNGLKQSDNADTYENAFTIDGDENAVISAVFESANMTMRYNKASDQKRFRYFGSGQQSIALYKLANEVVKPEAGLAWDPAEDITLTVGDAFTAPTLLNPNNIDAAEITIASSNPAVATVTAGVVALVADATGTTTITATFAGNASYKPAIVSYKIKVNPANSIYVSPSLNVNFGSVAKDATVEDKVITVTLTGVPAASVALEGAGASAFEFTPATLTASGDITISASSATAGTFAATLTISDDAGVAASKVVNLSLTVTDPAAEETPISTSTQWVAATAADLVDGAEVIITGVKDEVVYAMGEQKSTNRAAYVATVDGEGVLTPGEGTMSFTLVAQEAEGVFALRTSDGKYLYAAASGSNHMKTQDNVDVNAQWTLSVTSAVATGSSNRNVMQFNGSGTNKLFSCYASANQSAIQFYVPKPAVTPDYGSYERNGLTAGNYATICLPNGGTMSNNAKLFDLDYYDSANTLYLLEVNGNAMVAGRPYIFLPNETSIEVTYTDDANVTTAGSFNGLVGSYTQQNVNEIAGENYILWQNAYYLVNSTAYVGENRAYIHMADVPTTPTPQLGAAPRRRVAMTVNGAQNATGMENVQGDNVQCTKVLINGQMYILRGEKLFDATGRLVK